MNGYFERGEIYWVRMDAGLGTEQGVGRPGVVVTSNELNTKNTTVTIAFLSRKYHPFSTYVETGATGELSYVICNQLMSFDKSRLGKYIGKLNTAEQKAVDDALESVLDLGYQDDEALKEKDREIEARDAVIKEKNSMIQSLGDRMKHQATVKTEEIESLKIELAMWQRLYEKALNQVVDLKFTNDLFVRGHLNPKVAEPEEQPVVESPVEEPLMVESPVEEASVVGESQVGEPPVEEQRVDINTCTMTALKKLGFSLPMAKKIVDSRPFTSVEDLKKVNGLKANLFRVMEPKLCCSPVVVAEAEEPEVAVTVEAAPVVAESPVTAEAPVVVEESPVVKDEDPGFEPLDINTASGKDLIALGMPQSTAYTITGYRNKNGQFTCLDDLLKVQRVTQKMLDKYREYLTCVVPESKEEVAPVEETLNVNEATAAELMQVGFTKTAAHTIVAYRRKNGPYRNVYDLLKLADVTGKTLRKLGDKVRV